MSKVIDYIQDANILVVGGTTQSTNVSTGAVVVAGGIGVAKNVNIGENLDVLLQSTLGTLSVTDTTQSSSDSTGALVVAGGAGISKSLTVGDGLYVDNILATKYKDVQRQLFTNSSNTCSISSNGLWACQSNKIYFRKNTNEPFELNSVLYGGERYNGFSKDGKYLFTYGSNIFRLFSRNTETNVWTVNFQGNGGITYNSWVSIAFSSDGDYAFGYGQSLVRLFRRTPGANSWTFVGNIYPGGLTMGIYGTTIVALDCSNNGDRVAAGTREGVTVFRKTGDTSWIIEQSNLGSSTIRALGISMNDAGDLLIANITSTQIYKRTGTTWNAVFELPLGNARNKMSKDGSTVRSGNYIYKRITDDYWKLIVTFDNTIENLGISDSNNPAFDFNDDGSTLIISAKSVPLSYVYDIENEVSFEQKVKTKTINFDDTLKLTAAYGTVDHLVTLPPFNSKGSLINDGSGNTKWGEPFNQCLNKDCAVQFDSIGLSPNVGQINVSAQLQLSMRLINQSYTGFCAQVRRDTTFTVDYLLDTDLGNSTSLTGSATYTSTGGASSRGLFTATLAVSDAFAVDGTTLSSTNNGTRILLTGQNILSENGIWTTTITGTTLTLNRATDFDEDEEILSTDSFKISLGTTYGNTGKLLTTTDDPIILGGASGSDLSFDTIEVTKDIRFTAGIIDISELYVLLGSNDGYVSIWYDQSGNNNDFVQTVEASQPRILLTGGINWLPTVSFDGVDDYLDAGDVLDISTSVGWYVNLVADTNVTGGAIISKSTDSTANRWGLSFNGGNFDVIYEDTVDSTISTTQASGDPQIISLSIDRAAGTKTINSYIDNTIINTNIPITNDNTYNFDSATSVLLGAIDNAGLTYATGFISEVVIHNFAPTTTERVGLEQDQSSFYDITIVNIPKINLKTNPSIAIDYDLVLPALQGNNKESLVNDGGGNLYWRDLVQDKQLPSMTTPVIDQVQLKNYINSIKQTNSDRCIFPYAHGVSSVLNAYGGAVYSPSQNRIYFVPKFQAPQANWHYVDCDTGTIVAYAHGLGVTPVNGAYDGGAYSPTQNRIYFSPAAQSTEPIWHYIDCSNGSVVAYTHGATTSANVGAVYFPILNRIYFICAVSSTAQSVWHYVDCSNGNIVAYSHGASSIVSNSYFGGCLSPSQNRIYLIPYSQSSQANWHYIDASGSVVSYPRVVSAGGTYWGGSYSPTQNRIYLTPYGASNSATWVYIDCDTGSLVAYTHVGVSVGSNAFIGSCFSPTDNKIYFTSYSISGNANWVYIDCEDGSANNYTNTQTTANAYRGSIYSPTQNRIYMVPSAIQANWTYVKPLTTNNANISLMSGGIFNKF